MMSVHGLLFAGSCALGAGLGEGLQQSMSMFLSACNVFGLAIVAQGMWVMCQQHLTQFGQAPGSQWRGWWVCLPQRCPLQECGSG